MRMGREQKRQPKNTEGQEGREERDGIQQDGEVYCKNS